MAAKKVKSSKEGSVAKTANSEQKSALSRTAAPVTKRAQAKKSASSPAKAVKSSAPASKPSPETKVSAAKASTKPSAKTSSNVKTPAKLMAVAAPKASKKKRPAAAKAVPGPAGGEVHETESTISTGGQQATRSFSVIMQGHAAISQGIEARKAAAKAKNLARFPRPTVSKAKATRKLTPTQSKMYEQKLLRLRDELSRQIAFLRGASLTRSDEVNPEEDGSDAFERQLALKLASNEGDAIFEIDEALQRIKEGVYAICEDCGCIINSARLKALPFVRRCVECKRVAEKARAADDRRYF